jgi:hypothetical protein
MVARTQAEVMARLRRGISSAVDRREADIAALHYTRRLAAAFFASFATFFSFIVFAGAFFTSRLLVKLFIISLSA